MSAAPRRGLPSLLDYDDYRRFLRDHYAARKRLDPGFSYGVFSRRAGLASRSHLKLVIDRRLNLSPVTAGRFATALGLSEEEGKYFRLLVDLDQARSSRSWEATQQAIRTLRFRRTLRPSTGPEARAIVGGWARYLVYALTKVGGFVAEGAWISRRLAGRISPKEAGRALQELRRAGLVRTRGKRLAWTAAGKVALWGPQIPFQPKEVNRGLFRAAQEDLAAAHREERVPSFTAVTVPLTRQQADQLGWQLIAWVTANVVRGGKPAPRSDLYVFLGELFPLTTLSR